MTDDYDELFDLDARAVAAARERGRGTRLAAAGVGNSSLQMMWFDQRVDHFEPDGDDTFKQRYYVRYGAHDASHVAPDTPVFLLIGAEFELLPSELLTSEAARLADALGAVLVALEHRFYGASVPVANLSTDNLELLSTEQALADIAYFIEGFSKTLLGASSSAAAPTPPVPHALPSSHFRWLFFGCSYAASLVAWTRVRFPHIGVGGIASSGAVAAKADFWEYDRSAAIAVGPQCAASVRQATSTIEEALRINATSVMRDFNCTGLTSGVDFLYVLADVVAFTIQYNDMFADDSLQQDMCRGFETAWDDRARIEHYRDTAVRVFNVSGQPVCETWSLAYWTSTDVVPADNLRQWMWQSCSQLGYFQTAAPQSGPSLRSPYIDLAYHLDVCFRLFGEHVRPACDHVNEAYGGTQPVLNDTVFVNGAQDPWRTLSVTSSLKPTVPAIVMQNATHCADWYAPSAKDSACVVRGRALVHSYAAYFLAPLDVCGKCMHNATCELSPPDLDASTEVRGTCRCVEGWQGATCAQSLWLSAAFYIILIAAGAGLFCAFVGIAVGRALGRREAQRVGFARLLAGDGGGGAGELQTQPNNE